MSLKINKRVNGQRVCCVVMCRFERYRGRDHGGVMILTEKTQMTNTTKDARSIEPDAILRYGKMRIPLMAEDLSDLLANEFHGDQDDDWISPADLIVRDDAYPRFTPEASIAQHIESTDRERSAWDVLAHDPSYRVRAAAADKPLNLETYIELLNDRSMAVRHKVASNVLAIEALLDDVAGRVAFFDAMQDPEFRALVVSQAHALSGSHREALEDLLDDLPITDYPKATAFRLTFGHCDRQKTMVLTNPIALKTATQLFIEALHGLSDATALDPQFDQISETSIQIGYLAFAFDPRPAVREVVAQSVDRDDEAASFLAKDKTPSVRHAFEVLPNGLSNQEIENFLEDDPARMVTFMDSILKGTDTEFWLTRFLKDADPEVRRQAMIAHRNHMAQTEDEQSISTDESASLRVLAPMALPASNFVAEEVDDHEDEDDEDEEDNEFLEWIDLEYGYLDEMANDEKDDEARDDNDTATLTTPSLDTKTTHNIAKLNSQRKAF